MRRLAGLVFVVALMTACSGGLDSAPGNDGAGAGDNGDVSGQTGGADTGAPPGDDGGPLTRQQLAGVWVLTRTEITDRTGELSIFESGESGFEGELELKADGGFSQRTQLPIDDQPVERVGGFEVRDDHSLHIILPDCDYDSPISFTRTDQGRQLILTMPEGACEQDREQTDTWRSDS